MQRYESYKPSGNPWLGDIPAHWNVQPLIAIASKKSICNCPEKELLSVYLDRGVIKFSDVDEKRTNATSEDLSKYQEVLPGDFVLNNQQAWRGSVGVSEHEGIVSPAYVVLRLKKELTPRFANYLFRDGSMVSQYLICSKGVGTIQRNLYWPQLKRSRVVIPPQDEQQRIVTFLDKKTAEIDAAIAKKERLIESLIQHKDIQVNQAVTHGLDQSVSQKYCELLSADKMPEHWAIKKVKHVALVSPSKTLDGRRRTSESVCFLPMEKIGDDGTINGVEFKAAGEVFDGFTYFRKGDVAIAKITPCFENGKGAWLNDLPTEYGFGTTELHVLRPMKIYGEFLFRLLNRKMFLAEGEEFMVGSAGQKRIPTSFIANYLFACPPVEEQREICAWISDLCARTDLLIRKEREVISRLKELKQALITNAVTGQMKI